MKIKQLKSIVVKKKLKVPRKNSFGIQKVRSGFFVKLTDKSGVEGFGEGFYSCLVLLNKSSSSFY